MSSFNISREEFLSKHNSYDIPGMTQEEVDKSLALCNPEDKYPLYKVEKCPVCGKMYLGCYTICGWCGYEAECDSVDTRKEWYKKRLLENPDYIWKVG